MFKVLKHYHTRIKEGRLKEFVSQWLWIGSYIKRYWLLILIYTILGASGSALGLGTSMVSRNLIDAVTGQNTDNILSVASPLRLIATISF